MDERFHIDLDVQVNDGEVEGRVGDRCFTGWIELLAALDELLQQDSGGDPGAQPCG